MNQSQAFDILQMGTNVLLTGAAGSGKSFLVNRFISYCHDHGISVAVTASTGIAATHIGGMTIHSWSGMGIRDTLSDDEIEELISREYLAKRYARTAVLIIDEISMLSGTFIMNLDRILRSARVSPQPFGGMQVIFVGDFFQLPPISRGGDTEYAFEHPIWRRLEMTPCALTTQFRQQSDDVGDPLLNILTEIRSGRVSTDSRELLRSRDIPVDTLDHTELYTRNQSVDSYNIDRLAVLSGQEVHFHMSAKGSSHLTESLKKGCLAPELLSLKKDARVMFVKNNPEAGYFNGSIGHVIDFFEGNPIVELTNGHKIFTETTSWSIEENGKIKASIEQIPLRLAWAITIHKSQGMTLDTAVMNLLDAFVPGQGYVALSRVRTLEGLILRGFNEMALTVDLRVIDFEQTISRESERVGEYLASFTPQELQKSIQAAILRLGGVIEKISNTPSTGSTGKSEKVGSHRYTFDLIQQGKSLEEICEIRELKFATIWSHIEKLHEEGINIDLSAYRPDDETRLRNIHEAFVSLGTLQLTPAREYLGDVHEEEYSYDEIRIARLFLSDEDKMAIEGV